MAAKKTKTTRKKIDWDVIEKEYRAGQLSNVQIGQNYGVSEAAIRKKAKQEGWRKDLADRVRQEIKEKLVRGEVRGEVRGPNAKPAAEKATDKKIVDEVAERGVRLVLEQRKDIENLRRLEDLLINELMGTPTKVHVSQHQGKVTKTVLSLTAAERAQAANNLANVQHKRIQLQRQNYNLDDPLPEGEVKLRVVYDSSRSKQERTG